MLRCRTRGTLGISLSTNANANLMARILAISSQVAFGHVGLSAIVPTLQAMGHEVIAVPTVVLSCHYGYRDVGGFELTVDQFAAIMGGISANGWHTSLDAVITGYMPSLDVIEALASALGRLDQHRPGIIYMCDPVLGDDPGGLYIPEEVAAGIRDLLVPHADIITPNRFELEWLSGVPVHDAVSADAAAGAIGAELAAATSIPAGAGLIANVMSAEDMAGQVVHPQHKNVPHGTGDLFAALLLGYMLDGQGESEALARASAGVEAIVNASLGQHEMRLHDTLDQALATLPAELLPLNADE